MLRQQRLETNGIGDFRKDARLQSIYNIASLQPCNLHLEVEDERTKNNDIAKTVFGFVFIF